MQKIVHSFDAATRRYLGPVVLDESDRSPVEPGVWHIPGGCLEAVPPEIPAGHHVIADGSRWVLVKDPEPAAKLEAALPALGTGEGSPGLGQRIAVLAVQVQGQMDAVAAASGYADLASVISYADEMAVPKFCGEGRAFRAWRSLTWEAFYALAGVFTEDSVPTFADLLHRLPVLDMAAAAEAESAAQASRDAQAAALDVAGTPPVTAKSLKRKPERKKA